MTDRFTSRGIAAARFVAQRGLLKPLVRSLVSVTTHGEERLRGVEGAMIVVANHSSHLDAPLIIGWLPRRLTRYLAAGAAADYFFDVRWRRLLTALFFNAFAVERNGGRKYGSISRSLLERGVPLLIFPEGGRSKAGAIGSFKPGSAALAIATGVPCLPVALVGASEAMPRGTNWPKRGRMPIDVVFGEPMRPRMEESAQDFSARLTDEVRRLHASVRHEKAAHPQKGTR